MTTLDERLQKLRDGTGWYPYQQGNCVAHNRFEHMAGNGKDTALFCSDCPACAKTMAVEYCEWMNYEKEVMAQQLSR